MESYVFTKKSRQKPAPRPTRPGSRSLSAAGGVPASRPAVSGGPPAATSHCLGSVATQTLPKEQIPHAHEPCPSTAAAPTPRAPRAKLLGTPAPWTGPLRLRSRQGRGTQSSLHETPILDVRPTEPSNQSRSFQCSDVETLSQMTLRPTRTHRTLSSLPGTSRP